MRTVAAVMWALRSLTFRTDLFLGKITGEVIERDDYVVLRTPANPDFYWGNFLFYRDPPLPDRALDDHARELPGCRHSLITWDRPDGDHGHAEAFLPHGFALDEGSTLTARREDLVAPKDADPRIVVAPLLSEKDWNDAIESQTNAFAPRRSGTMEDLRSFVERQHAAFRAMQNAKHGQWWGARIDGRMAGSLGLVRVADVPESTLGRFQLVGTDPEYRRRGVCSTLVHHVARQALVDEGLDTLVMAADATYHAAKVYASVGFRPTETLVGVIKKPPKA